MLTKEVTALRLSLVASSSAAEKPRAETLTNLANNSFFCFLLDHCAFDYSTPPAYPSATLIHANVFALVAAAISPS